MLDTHYMGLATPQANPTVEIEFQQFFRGPVYGHYTRLTSKAGSPAERLVAYLEQQRDAIESFDTLPLSGFGFGCTGSSYLAGRQRECELADELSQHFGLPVISATEAIRREFERRGVEKIAILAPYPVALCEAANAYWEALGFEVATTARIDTGDDTRGIYQLTPTEVESALEEFATDVADVTLLSGTGMPTIAALKDAERPLISSNLCLATELLRGIGLWPKDAPTDINRLCERGYA